MKKHRLAKKRLGAATVEVAFTLPILLLIVFAGWEVCRINTIQNTMENAAYEAARESMLPGANIDRVQARADAVLAALAINGSDVTMDPQTINQTTDDVTITITAPVAENSLGVMKFFTNANLSTSMTLSRELQPGRF